MPSPAASASPAAPQPVWTNSRPRPPVVEKEAEDPVHPGPDLLAEGAERRAEHILQAVEDQEGAHHREHHRGEAHDLGVVREGPDQGRRCEDEQERDHGEQGAAEAGGDHRPRPGFLPLPGAHRIADPYARRRAEAHGKREGDIVDGEHRLEGPPRRHCRAGWRAPSGSRSRPAPALRRAPGTRPNQASGATPLSARRRAGALPIPHPSLHGMGQTPHGEDHRQRAEPEMVAVA